MCLQEPILELQRKDIELGKKNKDGTSHQKMTE